MLHAALPAGDSSIAASATTSSAIAAAVDKAKSFLAASLGSKAASSLVHRNVALKAFDSLGGRRLKNIHAPTSPEVDMEGMKSTIEQAVATSNPRSSTIRLTNTGIPAAGPADAEGTYLAYGKAELPHSGNHLRKLLDGATNSRSDRVEQAELGTSDVILAAATADDMRNAVHAATQKSAAFARLASRESARPEDFLP